MQTTSIISSTIGAKMRKITFRTWTVPFALLVVCVLAFGTLISKLGYYWDDWFISYYIHFFGPSSFLQATAMDRPLAGWLLMFFATIVGEIPLNWHIFALSARWLLCLAFWYTLYGLWPKKPSQVATIAFLFAVYPGFKQQFVAITQGIWFIVYALFWVSMGSMNWALRRAKWFWPLYILSIILCGFVLFSVEYFFGLEFLRPVFLWCILSETIPDVRERLRKVVLYSIPYACIDIAFLVYRLTTETPRGEITIFTKLSADPISALIALGKTIVLDVFKVSAQAWGQTFDLSGVLQYDPITIAKYVFVVLSTSVFIAFYLQGSTLKNENPSDEKQVRWRRPLQILFMGLFALVIAGIPFWMTDQKISLTFTRDRFTLPMMLGASLILYGLVELVTKSNLQRALIVGLLVGIAAGMSYHNALTFRQEWLRVKDFFWQLVWRVPAIEPGTIVMSTDMPFVYNWDDSLTAPLNWVYAPENTSYDLTYLYFDVESHLSRKLPELTAEFPIDVSFRLTEFSGNLTQAVLVIYQPPACLKVIDPINDRSLPSKPRFFREAMPFSDPTLILTDATPPAILPQTIFGPEPQPNWCYYFQKAELARQRGDWQTAADLGDQALVNEKKFYRKTVAELAPFIEGYARTGQWDRAVKLSFEAYQIWNNMNLMLCNLWGNVAQTGELDDQGRAAISKIQSELKCVWP